jgi:long-subunit fatty acid transport protein
VGTDISSILTHDEIDAEILGFSMRGGIIYEVSPKLNVGVSYLIPSTLVIRESYYSSILTELDDGSTPFESDFASDQEYEYRIKKPGQLSAGFALKDVAGFSLSISGEYIDHSNLSLDLVTGNDLGFDAEVDLIDQQSDLDASMEENYNQVINLKSSLGYRINNQFNMKAGYAFLPAKSKVFEADRNIISGGFSANITENIVLDINGQYSFWEDRSELYNYYDYSDDVARSEVVDQQVSTFKILAGIKFLF